jgi:prepilin-type N-terminal cleavage/methylation domain-containing protein
MRMKLISRRSSKRGFTLIELLVAIAIIAVAVSMMIPAVQSARRSAQSIRCRGNLAQLGAAFHSYHQSQGTLPPGSVDRLSPAAAEPGRFVWGWAIQLLPHLGEGNRYQALDPKLGVLATENARILSTPPGGFLCPGSSPSDPYGYAGCHSDQPGQILESNSGVLTLNLRVRFQDLPDGLHQTILLGEAAEIRWAEGAHGSLRSVGEPWGDYGFSDKVPKNSMDLRKIRREIREEVAALEEARRAQLEQVQSDYPPPPPPAEPIRDESEMESEESLPEQEMTESEDIELDELPEDESMGNGDGSLPPPPPRSEQLAPSRAFGFWTAHGDGGHFLLVDGSVRFLSRSIHREVLRQLANRLDTRDPGEF